MFLQAIAADITDTFRVNSRVDAYKAVLAIRHDYPTDTKFTLDGKEIFVSTGEIADPESRLQKLWNKTKPIPLTANASLSPEARIKKLRALFDKKGLDIEVKL
jgi:hypothetical protein